jgi:hypothetical protein
VVAPTVTSTQHRATSAHRVRSHDKSHASGHERSGPARTTAATADGHDRSGGHHRSTGHRPSDHATGRLLDPDTDIGRPGAAADDRGRCAGNSGAGIGNGGPQDADRADLLPDGPRDAATRAAGLQACD